MNIDRNLKSFLSAFMCVHLWLVSSATAADAVLHLADGSFIPGELRGSDDPKVLRWRASAFARPFEFPLTGVNAVHYAAPALPPKPQGEYCVELTDDTVLYGDLLGLTADDVELDSARLGRIHLRRAHVRRLYRWQGADLIYLGPNGLGGWKDTAASPQWRDEGGQLATDQAGASLFADIALPETALIEIELSWKKKPDFVFAMGVDNRDVTVRRAFHIEAWDGALVAVAESDKDADVVSLQQVGPGEGRIRIQAYLDQKHRRLILPAQNGNPLAALTVTEKQPQPHPGVRLTNVKGDVRLEQLRVSRWTGPPPRDANDDRARVLRTDGSIVYGQLAAYDPVTKQFKLRDGTTETTVGHDAIADVLMSPASAHRVERVGPEPAPAAQPFRVVYRDGSRFNGTLTRVEDAHLALTCPGIKEPLRLPLADVRSLVPPRPTESPAAQSVAGKPGRLEADDLRLIGRLVAGSDLADAGRLVWRPDLGRTASPLLPGFSGRIVYRDPPPPKPEVPEIQPPPQPAGMGQAFANMFKGAPVQKMAVVKPSLHLRSGDTIPSDVSRIDEAGVTFKTPLSDATFVPNEKIKTIDLTPPYGAVESNELKRDRLLTLPRMQKNTPPTHLICSRNGDFLRGRVLEMDATKLKVEVRGETTEIPRDRVAQIIWLHATELTPGPTAPSPGAPKADRVQIVRADGNRLTFVLENSAPPAISGVSDVLGACRADLIDLDQLLIGGCIEREAAKLAEQLWKLHHAPEPKFAQNNPDAPGGEGGPTGVDSPLVGQPAFQFKLDLLDGKKFNLADHKGRLVVVDFWATWCGPCMQTMPLIEDLAHEFADKRVDFVAVNMEEQPQQIQAVMERHKLKMSVALDRDGVVAAKFSVTAIPQTVVIDGAGKIVRLFVGGGKQTADSLRKALQDLSAGKAPTP
jgi:thiol-disulfide isomerase/thioredoxin